MKLVFRIETKKIKLPRIVVLRTIEKEGKITHKALGSFNRKKNYDHILKQLTSEELYEFENFLKVMGFSKTHFDCEADKLDRFIIKVAPEFKETLYKIWGKAKEFGLEFTPEYEMLSHLLQKAKIIEQQLALFTEGKFKALSKLGIEIGDINPPKRSLKEDQKLFAAVMEQTKSLEALAEQFNHIASAKYKKPPKFKPHHFEFFHHQTEQGKSQPFPKWYYTIAIDVLNKLGVKVENIISPALLTEHWLRLNKKETLEDTFMVFNREFPKLKHHTICNNVITASFINSDLSKMNQNPQAIATPSIAIEKWLTRWKEKHPKGERNEALKAFNKEFKLLEKNNFVLAVFDKYFQSSLGNNEP